MSGTSLQIEESGIAIAGVGLIGGSIAAALKARGFSGRIAGIGRNRERLEQARSLDLIDHVATYDEPIPEDVSLVVVCTPVDRIAADIVSLSRTCREGTFFTDAGSIKQAIYNELEDKDLSGCKYIGSHPMAGSEKNGFENADANLFEGRICIVTSATPEEMGDVTRLDHFWRFLGMKAHLMSARDHDLAVASTSHVPHLLAAALASALEEKDAPLTGTGFRDTSRIASGDPDLWEAIFLGNRVNVLASLDRFEKSLLEFRAAIEQQDSPGLKNLLEEAKKRRDSLDQ